MTDIPPEVGRTRYCSLPGEPWRPATWTITEHAVCPRDDDGQPLPVRLRIRTDDGASTADTWHASLADARELLA